MFDIIEELLKSEEQKRREEEALARNRAIQEQEVLDYTRRQQAMAVAGPRRAPDIQLPTRSALPAGPKPVSQMTDEELDYLLETQTAPLQMNSPRSMGAELDPAAEALAKMQNNLQFIYTADEAVTPEQAKIQGHSFYNQDALAGYLKRARAAGETPSFTNIPGASGFQINSKAAPPPSSVDGKFSEIKDPYSYTDPYEAIRAKHELDNAITNDLTANMKKIEDEEGVTRIETQLQSLIKNGWQNTEAAQGLGAQLSAARLRAAGRLTISKDGTPIGLEATPFVRARQMLGKYDIRINELSAEKDIDAKWGTAQMKIGATTEAMDLLRNVGGYKTPESMVAAKPQIKQLAERLVSGKATDLGHVIASYPEATDLYLEYIKANRTPDEAATISSTAKVWAKRVSEAGELAQARFADAANQPGAKGQAALYREARDSGDADQALAILTAVDRSARIAELGAAKDEVRSAWLSTDKLNPDKLVGVSEEDRLLAAKAVEVVADKHGGALPTGMLNSFNMRVHFRNAGLDPDKSAGLIRRMLRLNAQEFDSQYSSTLGVAMTTETPELKFWGM